MDPGQNADYAAGMISGLLKRYGGNVREALSAYNAGSPTATGTTTRWSGRTASSGYADSVLRHYHQLTGESPAIDRHRRRSNATVASVGELQSRAQSLPLVAAIPPPISAFAVHPARSYREQTTDYLALLDSDNDEKNS